MRDPAIQVKIREGEILESKSEAPYHYQLEVNGQSIEVKDIINAFIEKYLDHVDSIEDEDLPHDILYEWSNVIKYVLRAPFKGAMMSDLKKMRYCTDLILARMEKYYNLEETKK